MIVLRRVLLFFLLLNFLFIVGASPALSFPPDFPDDMPGEVEMTPKSGSPCTTVNVAGSNFNFQKVQIVWWNSEMDGDAVEVAAGNPDDQGKFDLKFVVPSDASPGIHAIQIAAWTDPCSGGGFCTADSPSTQKWLAFEVIEAGVGADAYCPAFGDLLSASTELTAIERSATITNTTTSSLPTTGFPGITITAFLAFFGAGLFILQRQRD